MTFLYDNMLATVVSMTVLLILVSIQMRATSTNVAQTSRNATLNQARILATWLEEDVKVMGQHMEEENPFEAPTRSPNTSSPTDSTLDAFSFSYYENEGGAKTTIEYLLSESDTMQVDGEQRILYNLERQRNGVVEGGGPATLGYFDVQFVGRNAGPVSNPIQNEEDIRAVRVHFSVVMPFQNDENILNEVHRKVVVPYLPAHD